MHAFRTSRIVALTLTLVAYPMTHAGAQMAASVGVAAGATVPRSRFGDRASTGYHVMVTLGMSAPLVPLSFRIEGMFNEFDYNSAVGSGGGGVYRLASDKARVWGATANGILTSSGLLRPYLIGGVGMYRTTEGNPPFGGTVSSNSWGGNLGGGFRFDLTGFGAYAEARYHWVGDTDVRMIPITFGLSF
jgi:hypothetical protein